MVLRVSFAASRKLKLSADILTSAVEFADQGMLLNFNSERLCEKEGQFETELGRFR